jgi:hypothetical protein
MQGPSGMTGPSATLGITGAVGPVGSIGAMGMTGFAGGVAPTLRATMYWGANTVGTSLTTANVYVKVVVGAGKSTLSTANIGGPWSLNSVENRLLYTGSSTNIPIMISISCSYQLSFSAIPFSMFTRLVKNGSTVVNGSLVRSTIGAQSTALYDGMCHATFLDTLNTGDYYELFTATAGVAGTTNAIYYNGNITITN